MALRQHGILSPRLVGNALQVRLSGGITLDTALASGTHEEDWPAVPYPSWTTGDCCASDPTLNSATCTTASPTPGPTPGPTLPYVMLNAGQCCSSDKQLESEAQCIAAATQFGMPNTSPNTRSANWYQHGCTAYTVHGGNDLMWNSHAGNCNPEHTAYCKV